MLLIIDNVKIHKISYCAAKTKVSIITIMKILTCVHLTNLKFKLKSAENIKFPAYFSPGKETLF